MTSIFGIKLLHTVVLVVESAAILYILYSGLFNVHGPLLVVAVILVVAEIVVFAVNGMHCPLTKLARRLGDTTGNDFVADIFLPERFARLIPLVCGGLALIGLLIVAARLLIA